MSIDTAGGEDGKAVIAESAADAGVLSTYLGDPLPPAEAAMWAAMSIDRRAKALQRMKTLAKWRDGEGGLTAARAAADAGVSLNRFFEMAKAWRADRSLAALGTFAKASRRLDPREAALKRIVGRVLGPWPSGSVRQMALRLGDVFRDEGGGRVGDTMLRRVVEAELRRREVERQLGNEIQFDCSACSLLRPDDVPYTVFAVLDRGSQLLLGAAVGDVAASSAGYASASRDALGRIGSGVLDDLPWVSRPARMELVAGLDADRWVGLREEMRAAGVDPPVEPSLRPDRFGRYLRRGLGNRVGLVDMWYGRTVPDDGRAAKIADRSLRLDVEAATAFIAAQVDDHNAERRSHLPAEPGARCPDAVLRALEHLAG